MNHHLSAPDQGGGKGECDRQYVLRFGERPPGALCAAVPPAVSVVGVVSVVSVVSVISVVSVVSVVSVISVVSVVSVVSRKDPIRCSGARDPILCCGARDLIRSNPVPVHKETEDGEDYGADEIDPPSRLLPKLLHVRHLPFEARGGMGTSGTCHLRQGEAWAHRALAIWGKGRGHWALAM